MLMMLSGVLESVSDRYPYYTYVLTVKGEGFTLEVEVPKKLAEEAGWEPKESEKVEVLLGDTLSREFDEYEVVYSGRVYLVEENEAMMSFGGILARLEGDLVKELSVDMKVYLGLRRK